MAFTVKEFQALNWFSFLPKKKKKWAEPSESTFNKKPILAQQDQQQKQFVWEKITEDQLKRTKMESQTHEQEVQRCCGPRQCLTGDLYKNIKAMRIKRTRIEAKWRFQITNTVYTFILSAHLTLYLLIEVVSTRHNDLIVWKCPNSKSSTKKQHTHIHKHLHNESE